MLSFPTRSELIPEVAAKPKPGEAIVSVGVPPVTAEARLDGMASGARDSFVLPLTFGNEEWIQYIVRSDVMEGGSSCTLHFVEHSIASYTKTHLSI